MIPKVSIVVPIYNVEIYLNRCINSIINQTYKNIEVILVDDGSPDNCGKLSDEYAEKDTRVKSVHKENGGLSDARNYGMKYVTGEYTFFLDSDDWLCDDIIEVLVNKSIEAKADIVQSGFYYQYKDHLLYDDRYYKEDDEPVSLDKQSLMKELVINERVKNFAWGKLYKTELIKDIPFTKGALFEDVFWAHEIMHRANKFVIVHKPMCYYVQRDDSIVATYSPRNLDILKGLKVRHKFIEKNYSHLCDESYKLILKTSFLHYDLLQANKSKDADGKHREDIRNYIDNNYEELLNAVKIDKELSTQLSLFKRNYMLSRVYVLSNKVLRKLKIKKSEPALKRINL